MGVAQAFEEGFSEYRISVRLVGGVVGEQTQGI